VCQLFAFRNQLIATPRAASELHSRGGLDFQGIARPNILRTGSQRPDQFLTASSAARGRRSERQRYGEQRSARASEWTPAPRRAAQREGFGTNTSATVRRAVRARLATGCWVVGWASRRVAGCGGPGGSGGGGRGAARGRPTERQRERRSARASVPTLTLRRAAQPEGVGPNTSATASSGRTAAGWRGEGVWGKWPPPPWPPGGGVGGSRWEGRLPPGRLVADWRGSGGKGRRTPVTKTAPHSSVLRTENKVFSLSKSSRFSQPGRSFSLSSTLCISTTAAVR